MFESRFGIIASVSVRTDDEGDACPRGMHALHPPPCEFGPLRLRGNHRRWPLWGNACRRAGVAARAQTAPDPDARAAAPGGATSSIASRCLGNARARDAHEKLPLEGTCVSST